MGNVISYGSGVSTPIRTDGTGSRLVMSSGVDRIREAMRIIVETDVEDRPFLTKNGFPFGTRCRRAAFEPMDVATSIIRYEIQRALTLWEPRIVVDSVQAGPEVDPNGNEVVRSVTLYRLRATNLPDSLVVDFQRR